LLVRNRLLAIHAVRCVLHDCFALEDPGRRLAPRIRALPMGPRDGRYVEAGRLADQVIVGGRMLREVAADELRVLEDRLEPTLAQALSLAAKEGRLRAAHELPCERPVDDAQPRFQRARPVRAHAERAAREPALEMAAKPSRIALVTRQREGLCERRQMLVPIRLPQVLDVTDDSRVAIVELHTEIERRLDAGLGIAVPVRWIAERHVAQREDIEAPGEDAIGGGAIHLAIDTDLAVDPRGGLVRQVRARHDAARQPPALGAHVRRLHHAVADFRRSHRPQAVDPPEDLLVQRAQA
jgi:hypothetical protein